MTPRLASPASALTGWHSIFNKAQYQRDLTTMHVNTAHWIIKITSCWKPAQTCVVSQQGLGYHENNPCFSASPSLWKDHFLRQWILWQASWYTEGTDMSLSDYPCLLFPISTPCCTFVYFHHVCAGFSGSYELQRVSVITLCYITACNLCTTARLLPTFLRSVQGLH